MPHPCKSILDTMTSRPGVYQMFSESGKIIYVGKAKNLKKRLQSYFRESGLPIKTQVMMQKVVSIEVVITENENAALLLEANLIKQHRPRYNILLRDDKSYPYLRLETESNFPRIDFYRGDKSAAGVYFGPYPNATAVREVLTFLQKVFRVRQCSDSFFAHRSRPCLQYQIKRCTAPCVGYVSAEDYSEQIKQARLLLEGKSDEIVKDLESKMHAASKHKNYETAALMRDQISMLRTIQSGQGAGSTNLNMDIVASILHEDKMYVALLIVRDGNLSSQRSFSLQAPAQESLASALTSFLVQYYVREEIPFALPEKITVTHALPDRQWLQAALCEWHKNKNLKVKVCTATANSQLSSWITNARNNVQHNLDVAVASKQVFANGFRELAVTLSMETIPEIISCFDISHTQGEATQGACVVADQEGFVRRQYRRLNIKTAKDSDDYAAMAETVSRFLQNLKEKEQPLPDLLLIDGGKGQLSAVMQALEDIQVSGIAVCAIAKGPARKSGQERLFVPGREAYRPASDDKGFLFLRKIRDEVHRYAITGHRRKRDASRVYSSLETIPGVGEKTRQKLLTHFGGLQGVKAASAADLEAVPGISKIMADKIYNALHG